MRIAFLSQIPFDPANSGGKLRRRHLVEALQRLGHEVFVHHRTGLATSPGHAPQNLLVRCSRRPLRTTPDPEYRYIEEFVSTNGIEVVVAEHPVYTDLVCSRRIRRQASIVIDTQNFEGGRAASRAARRNLAQQMLTEATEALYLRRADRVWALSKTDASVYALTLPLAESRSHPIQRRPPRTDRRAIRQRARRPLRRFVKTHKPNVEAVEYLVKKLLPICLRARPGVRFVVVGRRPPKWLVELQSPNLLVTGEVSDVGEWYRDARLVVAPMGAGGGVKTKVLEAMAYAKPVLASRQALQGITAFDGKDIITAPMGPPA